MNVRTFKILAGLLLALPVSAMAQSWHFSTCGAAGYQGPSQGDCDAAYTATTLDGNVTVSGGIQSWTAPATGSYRITAVGAAGKSATNGEYDGGRGARITGTFNLTAGDILQIVVGQEGSASTGDNDLQGESPTGNAGAEGPSGVPPEFELDGGGGGGSFVVNIGDNPLLIAGGGGGTRNSAGQNGCDATTGEYATTSSGSDSAGGCEVKVDGLGVGGIALAYYNYGSAGAGFNGNGESDEVGQGGQSWANGMLGGHIQYNFIPADGGFGGGGTGEGDNGGGGGGGYSGGDGGFISGGGGSYNDGDQQSATAGVGTGDGSVTIRLLVPGEGNDTRTTFAVTKDFSDGQNPTEVQVTINCFTGLPLTQTQGVYVWQGVTFVVTDFDDGELDCNITEEPLNGYTPTYEPGGPGEFNDDGGCNFDSVYSGDENTCHIINDVDEVAVEIEKLWVIDGSGGDLLDTHYKLTLHCDAEITDGDKYCHGGGGYGDDPVGFPAAEVESYCKKFEGDSSQTFTAWVTPEYPGSHCWVDEKVYDDSVEIENNCGDLSISAGEGDSCLITNTVFYEGIPTLNQYGMAILALLMLGIGFVGFRRFA